LLLRPERLDLRLQRLLVRHELLLLVVEPLHLDVELLELLLDAGLPLECLPGEVLVPGRERLTRLLLELDDALLERAALHLEPLLRRDDVGHAALDVLQELELLLVGVVERLGRILRLVDQGRTGHQAGHEPSSLRLRVAYPAMLIERSVHPDYLSNAYLVADEPGGVAVFVD